MRLSATFFCLTILGLAGCHEAPNIKSAGDYDPPLAPPLLRPYYNPYAPYGQANATWTPAVINRNGTVVKPADPSVNAGRPDYERALWATGAAGGSNAAPPGTF